MKLVSSSLALLLFPLLLVVSKGIVTVNAEAVSVTSEVEHQANADVNAVDELAAVVGGGSLRRGLNNRQRPHHKEGLFNNVKEEDDAAGTDTAIFEAAAAADTGSNPCSKYDPSSAEQKLCKLLRAYFKDGGKTKGNAFGLERNICTTIEEELDDESDVDLAEIVTNVVATAGVLGEVEALDGGDVQTCITNAIGNNPASPPVAPPADRCNEAWEPSTNERQLCNLLRAYFKGGGNGNANGNGRNGNGPNRRGLQDAAGIEGTIVDLIEEIDDPVTVAEVVDTADVSEEVAAAADGDIVKDVIVANYEMLQRDALVALYNSAYDSASDEYRWCIGWCIETNWLSDMSYCDWYGVSCDAAGNVESLDLSSNNLVGSLPSQIGDLIFLKELVLADNGDLTNPIPPEIKSLELLEVLHLTNAGISGPIPTEIGFLRNLRSIRLESTKLTGSLPTEIGNLESLEELVLTSASISGSIPTQIGRLQNLERLLLFQTQISGSIPPEIGECSSLETISMFRSTISGTIPSEIGSLANLRVLWLQRTNVSGSIPSALGSMKNLSNLRLADTDISGSIPPEIGDCSGLVEVWLDNTSVSGTIPSSFGGLTRLRYIQIQETSITGDIPDSFCDLFSDDLIALFTATRENPFSSSPRRTGIVRDVSDPSSSEAAVAECKCAELPYSTIFRCTQCGALKALYISTNGDGWRNNDGWPTSTALDEEWESCCTDTVWGGVTCDDNGNIVGIDLESNNLQGTVGLPTEMGLLQNLVSLKLYDNDVSGPFPTELGSLQNLVTLDLSFNQVSGLLPTEIGLLQNLQDLDLSSNDVSGSIPTEIGSLKNLQDLDLSSNTISGPLPTEIGSMQNLEKLDLASNEISEPLFSLYALPTELGLLPKLREISLSDNSLSGSLPTELGSLVNLVNLGVSFNLLSGSLPAEIGSMQNLVFLDLSRQFLSGPLPAELGLLENLVILDLSDNLISGPLPSEIGLMKNLRFLYLSFNEISGPLPPEIGDCAELVNLWLDENTISGPLPTELGSLQNLGYLDLNSNQITGPLPTEIGLMQNLQYLYLSTNEISGPLPSEIGDCLSLVDLWLDNTSISGSIPLSFGRLQNLRDIRIQETSITGDIPDSFCDLFISGDLSSFYTASSPTSSILGIIRDVSDPLLAVEECKCAELPYTGVLSDTSRCRQCDALKALYIATNGDGWSNNAGWPTSTALEGQWKSCCTNTFWSGVFCDANGNVESIFLVENNLQGTVGLPTELGLLQNVVSLDLSSNDISQSIAGPLPKEIGSMQNLEYLNLSFNKISGPLPPEFGSLQKLVYLFIDNTYILGEIPSQVCALFTGTNKLFQIRHSAFPIASLSRSTNFVTGPLEECTCTPMLYDLNPFGQNTRSYPICPCGEGDINGINCVNPYPFRF